MVRPIERQESVLQSPLTERIQQVQQQHADMQQRYFHIQLAQERRKHLTQVRQPDQIDRMVIGEEDQGERREQSKPQHGQHDPAVAQPSGEFPEETGRHAIIDIEA